MRKRKKTSQKVKSNTFELKVLRLISEKGFSTQKILESLNIISKQEQKKVKRIVRDYRKKQKEVAPPTSNDQQNTFVGTVDFVNPRYAYIVMEEGKDIFVRKERLLGAFDGDTVKVSLLKKRTGKKEGKVIEIVKRARKQFVGRLAMVRQFAFVTPDSKKYHNDFFIPSDKLNGAKHNDKVLIKFLEWDFTDKNPTAQIVRVLGQTGEHNTEMHAIILEYGFSIDFPSQVLNEAELIDGKIPEHEVAKRKDFRDITTFTIDPDDAKDFDDALSVRKLSDGLFEIGIHIADVTHYVAPKTKLEEEAYSRATSVYLVDRTVHMLPKKLSNNVCSLRPNEDKLTFSAVFEIDQHANVISKWFGKTIICSNRRFTYDEAQKCLDTQEGKFANELKTLNDIAKQLKSRRFEEGSIDFESVEIKFELDAKGVPLSINPKARKDAHKLVEEFMLLANKKVAEYIYEKNNKQPDKNFVYRVHELPDEDKIKVLMLFVNKFGYQLKIRKDNVKSELNNLAKQIEGKPEQNILENLAIRSMAKAKYSNDNVGHFGLGFSHYTHFTSPIRRYPDMMVHRMLEEHLKGSKSKKIETLKRKCLWASEREKFAATAERSSIKYKQVEYIKNSSVKEYEGVISSLTDWGMYVELLGTYCEGMLRIGDLKDDYYYFDAKSYSVIGKNNKKTYTLGDKVHVCVINADVGARQIDLELI